MLHSFNRSLRELIARIMRSSLATRAHPHVYFAPNVTVGPNCSFGSNVKIFHDSQLSNAQLGDYSYVSSGARLQNVRIGKFCSIGPGVRLGLGSHPVDQISTYPGFYSVDASGGTPFVKRTWLEEYQPIEIGNDVWIGSGVQVVDGVNIGHGAVIAAGSIVTKDVAPYAIVGGIPATRIKDRFDQNMIDFLLTFRWWDKDKAFFEEHADLFRDPQAFHAAMMPKAQD